jgi:hypothetical protein
MILDFNSFIINEDVVQKKDAKSDISKFQQFTKTQAEQQSTKSSKPAPKPVVDDSNVHKSIETAIKDVETQKSGINQGIKTLDDYTKAKIASTPNPTDPNAKKQQAQQNKDSETIKKDLNDRVKKFSDTVKNLQKEKDKLIKK